MSFTPEPAVRYDMPAVFGPSLMPPVTDVDNATAVILSYESDPAAVAKLLPYHFKVADPAIVSISRISYPSTDYMGGRGYNEIVVLLTARYEGRGTAINAAFAPVLWVDQFGALFAGREFQGLAKLTGELPTVEGQPDSDMRFHCSEYGARLLEGEVRNLSPITGDKLEAVRKSSAAVPTFGWKYIPSCTGQPDADYPLVNYTRWRYAQAWSGEGSVRFMTPSASEAPFSARVVAALAALPVRRWRRAFVGRGTVAIDRSMSRRLDTSD